MAKNKPVQKKTDTPAADEYAVRLKPLFGIRPGVYLSVVYGAAILLVLFLILVRPGLKNPGCVLVVSSEPKGAACRVDGIFQEAAPCEVFVPQGKRTVEIVLPGFEMQIFEIEVPGRVFASLFFPKKIKIHGELKSANPAAAFKDYAAEFAAWSFMGEPTAVSQIPMSLSDGAYRLGTLTSDPAVLTAMEETLYSSLGYGVTRAALRDLLRAKFLIDNQGISPSPLGLMESVSGILAILAETPGASFWLADLLQGEAGETISSSSWYAEEIASAISVVDRAAPVSQPVQPGTRTAVSGIQFRNIHGGVSVQGAYFPREVQVEDFMIAEAQMSRDVWENFMRESPEWRRENTDALAAGGLATIDYLSGIALSGAPTDGTVTAVSWHAARAFCEWFSSRLPSAYSGWELRLPTEAEWQHAADAMPDMLRNHWEWCSDSFAPLDIFSFGGAAVGPERSVRGGSWYNPAAAIKTDTRGSLPPETCSVFVSFRPVLARKGAFHE